MEKARKEIIREIGRAGFVFCRKMPEPQPEIPFLYLGKGQGGMFLGQS